MKIPKNKCVPKNMAPDHKLEKEYIEEGVKLSKNQNNDQAIEAFKKALQCNKKSTEAMCWLARIYASKNENDDALEILNEVIKIDQECEEAYRIRYGIHREIEDHESIINDCNILLKILKKDNTSIDYFKSMRFYAYLAMKEYQTALDECDHDIKTNIENVSESYSNRALVYHELGEYDKAVKDYVEALRLKDDEATIIGLCDTLIKKGSYDDVIEYCGKIIDRGGKSVEAYVRRIYCYTEKGEYEKALIDCNTVIKRNSHDYHGYLKRSRVFHKMHDYDNAIKDCSKAIELADTKDKVAIRGYHTDLYCYRGDIYKEAKMPEEAAKDYKFAISHGSVEAKNRLLELFNQEID